MFPPVCLPHFAIKIKLCPSIRISVCYSVSALIFSVGVWSFSLMSIIHCPFLPKPPIFLGFSPPFWYFIWSPHHAASLCLPTVSVPKGAIALGHFGDKTFACHLIPSGHHTARSKKFQPIFTYTDFLTDTNFNLGGRGVPLSPNIEQPWTKALDIKYPLRPLEIFLTKQRIWPYILVSIFELQILIMNSLDRFIIYTFIPIPILTDFWDF